MTITPSSEAELRQLRGLINMQNRYSSSNMDPRTTNNCNACFPTKGSTTTTTTAAATTHYVEGKKIDFRSSRSISQKGHGRRMFSMSYFSLESMLLLICLTASLLILPLILPPLPPPPLMLLMLPICILAVLMMLAFMPSNAKDVTRTYTNV